VRPTSGIDGGSIGPRATLGQTRRRASGLPATCRSRGDGPVRLGGEGGEADVLTAIGSGVRSLAWPGLRPGIRLPACSTASPRVARNNTAVGLRRSLAANSNPFGSVAAGAGRRWCPGWCAVPACTGAGRTSVRTTFERTSGRGRRRLPFGLTARPRLIAICLRESGLFHVKRIRGWAGRPSRRSRRASCAGRKAARRPAQPAARRMHGVQGPIPMAPPRASAAVRPMCRGSSADSGPAASIRTRPRRHEPTWPGTRRGQGDRPMRGTRSSDRPLFHVKLPAGKRVAGSLRWCIGRPATRGDNCRSRTIYWCDRALPRCGRELASQIFGSPRISRGEDRAGNVRPGDPDGVAPWSLGSRSP
jgi:hypothetical protein